MTTNPPPLAQAIARHKAAQAALAAVPHDEDCPAHLCMAELDALSELAETPCASDAEFVEKLRYLHAFETRLGGAQLVDMNSGASSLRSILISSR